VGVAEGMEADICRPEGSVRGLGVALHCWWNRANPDPVYMGNACVRVRLLFDM
jgi:hypothetical protein